MLAVDILKSSELLGNSKLHEVE